MVDGWWKEPGSRGLLWWGGLIGVFVRMEVWSRKEGEALGMRLVSVGKHHREGMLTLNDQSDENKV